MSKLQFVERTPNAAPVIHLESSTRFAEMVAPAGQDVASVSIAPGREPDLLAIDSRACGLCGLTIDRHEMVDHGEGPEHYCPDLLPDEMTLDELERRAELRRQEEVAEILARMDAMDCPAEIPPPREPEPYRPAASTAAAFWFLVSLDEPERLEAWLLDHPKDAPTLLKLLETKQW